MNIIEHRISQTFDRILSDRNLLNEILIDVESNESKYPNLIFHHRTKKDKLPKALLDDLQKAAASIDFKLGVNWAKTGHRKFSASGYISRHWRQLAVDIGYLILPDGKKIGISPKNKETVEKFTNILKNMGYVKNAEGTSNPKAFLTFGFEDHDDHVHVSNATDESFEGEVKSSSTEELPSTTATTTPGSEQSSVSSVASQLGKTKGSWDELEALIKTVGPENIRKGFLASTFGSLSEDLNRIKKLLK